VADLVIEVRLYASLKGYRPSASEGNVVTVDVPDGISLGELMEEMELNPVEVKSVVVNGVDSNFEQVLFDGDRVALYPADFAAK